ncbi:MAG: ABC transporter ATP-binding protein, partial [Lachnospiraceae bacterium]|nr:ABC transporter ATP-binding protein [Lachnospiraceae bacterium]
MIGAIIMSFTINRRLAMILLVVMPVLMMGILILIKVGFPRFMKLQEKVDALNNNVRENLTNVRVIKSFVREKDENKKFAAANEDLADTGISALRILVITWPFFSLVMDATVLLVVWLGGQQIIAGEMEVGSLTAFISYIFQVLFSLMMLAMILLQVPRASASSKRIKEVLGTDVDLNDIYAEHKDAIVEKGGITFKDVSFRYYKDSPESVLAHIDLDIKPGETLGIIGPTGCGKTTLVSLIPRLYDVDEGQVLVDGIDVRDYSLKNLREGVGMVLQKNVLFSGTIAENLKWGDPEADMSVIEEFADKAQADAFVKEFTDGYETILGQGGVNVSGGQKQRLCIARALLKKPKILILDDSTSAVDTATERKIREAFNTTLQDTTTIIIAQRITSVMDADKIVVMEDGVITGVGTHAELLKSNVLYQEIYDSQMENAKEVG